MERYVAGNYWLSPTISRPLHLKDLDITTKHVALNSMRGNPSSGQKQGCFFIRYTDGVYEGAELYTLIGTYTLRNLDQEFLFIQAGSYRDGRLIFTCHLNYYHLDGFRKNSIIFFQRMSFKIIIESNLNTVFFFR